LPRAENMEAKSLGHEASEVVEGLWVGGVRSLEGARGRGLTHLVCVCHETGPPPPSLWENMSGGCLYLPAADHPQQDLISHFDQLCAYIHSARAQGGMVLVQCLAGASRSVAVACAYLMRLFALDPWEACTCPLLFHKNRCHQRRRRRHSGQVEMVRKKRREADPNPGFLEQLRYYEAHLATLPSSSAGEWDIVPLDKAHQRFIDSRFKKKVPLTRLVHHQ